MKKFLSNLLLTVLVVIAVISFIDAPPGEYLKENFGIDWFVSDEKIIAGDSRYFPTDGYGADFLTESQADLYRRMAEAVNDLQTYLKVDFDLTEEELSKMYYCFQSDYPQLFWSDGYSYTLKDGLVDALYLEYSTDRSGAKAMWRAAEEQLSVCNEQLDAVDGDFEKELWINDYLCETVTYEEGAENCYSVYGALVQNRAVCSGYARAAQLLLMGQDIPCLYVRGIFDGQRHGWNIAFIGGEPYHLDVTWNDLSIRGDLASHPGASAPSYAYFNLTDSMIQTDHQIVAEENAPLPICDSTAENYFVKTGRYAESDKAAAEILTQGIVNCAASGSSWVDVMFCDLHAGENFVENKMGRVFRDAERQLGDSFFEHRYSYSFTGENGAVRIFLIQK